MCAVACSTHVALPAKIQHSRPSFLQHTSATQRPRRAASHTAPHGNMARGGAGVVSRGRAAGVSGGGARVVRVSLAGEHAFRSAPAAVPMKQSKQKCKQDKKLRRGGMYAWEESEELVHSLTLGKRIITRWPGAEGWHRATVAAVKDKGRVGLEYDGDPTIYFTDGCGKPLKESAFEWDSDLSESEDERTSSDGEQHGNWMLGEAVSGRLMAENRIDGASAGAECVDFSRIAKDEPRVSSLSMDAAASA